MNPLINSLKEITVLIPEGQLDIGKLKEVSKNCTLTEVEVFVFDRNGLAKILSEAKHTPKTIAKFLQEKGTKYI